MQFVEHAQLGKIHSWLVGDGYRCYIRFLHLGGWEDDVGIWFMSMLVVKNGKWW
jgi:hypothetical protein